MTFPIILLIAGLMASAYHIGYNRALLSNEKEVPPTRFLGGSSHWSEQGRAVEIFSILYIPVHVDIFNHSTLWLD